MITFSVISGPRKISKFILRKLKYTIEGNEKIKIVILGVLRKFPTLNKRLNNFVNSYDDVLPSKIIDTEKKEFFQELKIEIEKYKNDRVV